MRLIIISFFILFSLSIFGQQSDSIVSVKNSAEKMLLADSKLSIGGYGEIHYNQQIAGLEKQNGLLDVHRLVMLFAYRFNRKLQFVSEIEFEHVKEVYVEQAFLQYKVNPTLNFRGGLLLIPFGIVNEYHEPTAFFGVERPSVDKYIVPTTWREIGVGINGNLIDLSLKYQLYLVNGFNGFDGSAKLNGKNGLRSGRQKGAESYISSPALTGRIDYYGFYGMRLGLSAYYGKSQSTMFDGLNRDDVLGIERADSTVVGISMLGFDVQYNKKAIKLKGQLYYTSLANTHVYNAFSSFDESQHDLGSAMLGYYFEAAYDLFYSSKEIKSSLYPFVRWEFYDTHFKTAENLPRNPSFSRSVLKVGLNWYPAKGVVVKSDIHFENNKNDENGILIFNAGLGVMF